MNKEKIGQMVVIRMHGKKITEDLVSLIRDYHIGGISLYTNNYSSYDEMLSLINSLKELNSRYNKTPLFIAIDQEGGRVNRLPKEFLNLPPAKRISIDKKYIKESGSIIGDILYNLGINMNFAPVLDIQRFPDNHAIGDRCFGDNKEDVTTNGIIMMNEISKRNVIPVVKHFPGHGLVKKDSHFFLPVINKDIKESDDIYPFKEAIINNSSAMMISHIMIRKMDKIYPASLSKKIVTNYLKEELKYDGLIITDDIKMKAVNFLYGYKKSFYKAVEAGNNVILIGSSYGIVKECIDNVLNKMTDEIEKNINNSYKKIINVKKEYDIKDKSNKKMNVDFYNKKIEKIRDEVM